MLSLFFVSCAVLAQSYPARPIRFVVPFPPGGDTDSIGRAVAGKLAEGLGQPTIVDNRAGAGGTIGTAFVAKSLADGYTVLLSPMGLAVNSALYQSLPYDAFNDLAPISMIGSQGSVLVVNPSVPVNSLADLLALVRANPGKVTYASGGFGSATYLAAEMLNYMGKLKMVHVPYKGAGPALVGLLGGEVQVFIAPVGVALPMIKAGRIKPLAVTMPSRSSLFPDVPTVSEAGVPGYEFLIWYGLLAPAGTARPVINRLNAEVARMVGSADLKEKFAMLGMESSPGSPEQFSSFLKSETQKWIEIVRATGARAE